MGSVKTHKNITNMYFRTCSWMWRNVKDKRISSMLYYLTMDFKPRLYLFTITNVLVPECSNSRGISLLSVVGKLYGRVLIKELGELWAETECVIGVEQ